MMLVEKMARAMRESDRKCAPGNWNEWPQAKQAHREGYLRRAAVAIEAIKPSEDMIETIAGEMDVAMQMEFNAVFAKDLLKRMARSACFALVNAAILQQNQ